MGGLTIFLMHGIGDHRSALERRDGMLFAATKGTSMINRLFGTSARLVHLASQPVSWTSMGKTARGLMTTMQHTLTVFGLSAVAVMALLYANPDAAKTVSRFLHPDATAPVAAAAPVVVAQAAPAPIAAPAPADLGRHAKAPGNTRQQQNVTSWLAKRYRVAGDAANMLVSTAYLTAREIKLDPLLILAVMAIESGLNPFAESPVGAQGLMQVMSKIHHDKFQEMGGLQAALNPVANIRVGSLILKDYVQRGGSVEAGLKIYVGAAAFEHDDGYGSKVLAEYNRLKQVSAGKKVPTITPMLAAAKPQPQQQPQQQTAPIAAAASADHETQIAGL